MGNIANPAREAIGELVGRDRRHRLPNDLFSNLKRFTLHLYVEGIGEVTLHRVSTDNRLGAPNQTVLVLGTEGSNDRLTRRQWHTLFCSHAVLENALPVRGKGAAKKQMTLLKFDWGGACNGCGKVAIHFKRTEICAQYPVLV